jgi:prepilin-type N-terminal cleavage/methylation domain-containing protein
MNFKSKNGFTLMELMIYIALLGVIVIIAGQAFSDSTKMRVRTQSMLQASQIAGNVSFLIKEDFAQIGAKSSQEASDASSMDVFSTDHIHDVFMNPDDADNDKKDSSSFNITKDQGGPDLDSIAFRRMRYDQNGHYVAVEEITWYVEDNELKRGCQTLSGTEDGSLCPTAHANVITIAEGVQKFTVIPAEPGSTELTSHILPSSDTSIHKFRLVPRYGDDNLSYTTVEPYEGEANVELSGFATNYNYESQEPVLDGRNANQVFLAPSNGNSGNWKALCKKITLNTNTEYEISFSMGYSSDNSRLFCPGRDYMGVGFRYVNDAARPSEISDFMFYPPASAGASEGTRKFRFSVKNTVPDVCLAFTFATYSPSAASGKITLSNVTLKKVETANYVFNDGDIDIPEKKNVKAMRVNLAINVRGESSILSVNIPIPSNGIRD